MHKILVFVQFRVFSIELKKGSHVIPQAFLVNNTNLSCLLFVSVVGGCMSIKKLKDNNPFNVFCANT